MNLDQLIAEARERRAQAEADVAAAHVRRAREEIANFQGRLADLFGELTEALDIVAESDMWATCQFNDRPYRLHMMRHEWMLVRWDERADDDERRRPSREFYATFHTSRDNRDNLLLALAELDDAPEVPFPPARPEEPAPAPRVMNDYEAQLLDALRVFLQHER